MEHIKVYPQSSEHMETEAQMAEDIFNDEILKPYLAVHNIDGTYDIYTSTDNVNVKVTLTYPAETRAALPEKEQYLMVSRYGDTKEFDLETLGNNPINIKQIDVEDVDNEDYGYVDPDTGDFHWGEQLEFDRELTFLNLEYDASVNYTEGTEWEGELPELIWVFTFGYNDEYE